MTIEGLDAVLSNIVTAGLFFAGFNGWFFQSVIEYNSDRIELLEKKAEKYDALCDNVTALNDANRIDREYIKLLEQKINQLKYDMMED
jgi:Zn-dependent M32 family carboxypeptidase